MDSANELGSELALAFLVEKKYAGKINPNDILALIGKIREVLQPLSVKENSDELLLGVEKASRFGSH